MASAATSSIRPQLAVDTNMAHTAGRNPRQDTRALMHAARSAQAPQVSAAQGGFSSDEDDEDQQRQNYSRHQYDDADYDDPNRQYDQYDDNDSSGDMTARAGSGQSARNYISTNGQQQQQQQQQSYEDYEDDYDDAGHPLQDDDDREESEEELDDDDDDLSSSPSIPDENIDFDLVYSLHSFAATVEGQATVEKGQSLMLLDDSNSYWWLVRVLETQEVGYIPAENIETPYERLARLNKHRNVGLTSATDDDHIQVPSKIYSSHLVKQRDARDKSGLSVHSGKLSALSRRRDGAPAKSPSPQPVQKPSVIFGPPSYVEHSGDEYETDDDGEYEEEDSQGEYEDEDEYDDYEQDEQDDHHASGGVDDEELRAQLENGYSAPADVRSRQVEPAQAQAQTPQQQQQQTAALAQTAAGRKALLSGMEPDDGMDWDAADVEKMQRDRAAQQQQAQQQQQQQQQQRDQVEADGTQRRAPGSSWDNAPMDPQQPDVQQGAQNRQLQQQPTQQQQQRLGTSTSGIAGSLQRPVQHLRKTSSERTVSSINSASTTDGPLLPSEVQAGRDRNASFSSNTSTVSAGSSTYQPGGQYGRGSPMPADARKEKHQKRKSKGSIDAGDDSVASSTNTEEKGAKKRSGVFSGLFSRNKDKKERKSGSFSSAGGAEDSSILARNSEDIENYKQREAAAAAAAASGNYGTASPSTGMGRSVQERDRAQQEAYSRQFLGNRASGAQDSFTARNGSGKPRPGSLMGTPNTVPMLNVLRVFAGDDIDSDATFKTVLLNDTTSTRDLMRQAMQRFRLPQVPGGYVLVVKSLEGNERGLGEEERPLQVFDSLSEMGSEAPTMPSVKRSSVGSISSISSNLSLNPAIMRANDDFSDDHAVKFYLRRRFDGEGGNASRSAQPYAGPGSNAFGGAQSGTSFSPSAASGYSQMPEAGDPTFGTSAMARFALRLLIFPGDVPEGMVFDPQSPALIPESVLTERGPSGSIISESVEHRYREKLLSLPKNATVAEVIEGGLDRFGIADGVVEGGDDVEDRTNRRRSKPRIKYGLTVEVRQAPGQRQERPLPPTSKILDAFPAAPVFRTAPTSAKRRSADSAMLLNMAEDQIKPEDPVFILRIIGAKQPGGAGHGLAQGHQYPGKSNVRSLSPTEGRLAERQEQRRQEELSTVRSPGLTMEPSSSSLSSSSSATPRSLIAAQRAAAQERKAAVLGAQRNDQQGVDVYLGNDAKIRSSRSLEGKVRYSYLPGLAGSEELDISVIVEDVLADHQASAQDSATLRPGGPLRDQSTTTLNSFQSAPSTPIAQSPIELSEANIDYVGGGTAPLSLGSKQVNRGQPPSKPNRDLLEGFVRNTQNSETTIENRIDQVLSRVAGGGAMTTPIASKNGKAGTIAKAGARQASGGSATTIGTGSTSTQHRPDQSSYGSEDLSSSIQDSPRSASTNPTPVSAMNVAAGAGALVVGPTAGLSAVVPASRNRSTGAGAMSSTSSLPAAYIPSDDFGLDHLYTIVDAAMRRDPKKYTRVVVQSPSQSSSGASTPPASSKHNSTVMTLAPKREPIRAQVGGLFGPNEEAMLATLSNASSRAVYGPIKGQLDKLDEGLDALLMEVQRVL